MRLVVITQPFFFASEAQMINRMFASGLETLHLRKPSATLEQVERLIAEINEEWLGRIVLHSHFELVTKWGLRGCHFGKGRPIENYGRPAKTWELSTEFRGSPMDASRCSTEVCGCSMDTVRRPTEIYVRSVEICGQPVEICRQPTKIDVRSTKLCDRVWTRSYSCHSLEEVVHYKKCCDYVFLSPVFNSISKRGYRSAFTDEEFVLAAQCGVIDSKVFALGGVSDSSLCYLAQRGFGGAVVLGDVWENIDPPARVVKLLDSISKI